MNKGAAKSKGKKEKKIRKKETNNIIALNSINVFVFLLQIIFLVAFF